MSEKDRKKICEIISQMLDNPDDSGIYPTSTAFTALEHYVEQERHTAIGWMHAEACHQLDAGRDPRTADVPEIIEKAVHALSI